MKMKMQLTSGLLGVAALLIASQANAATISLTPSVTNVAVNDPFSLTVEGTGFDTGATSGGVILSWDTSIVQQVGGIAAINLSLNANGIGESFNNSITLDGLGIATAVIDGFSFLDLTDPLGNFTFVTIDFIAVPPPGSTDVAVAISSSGNWQDAFGNGVLTDGYLPATVNVSAVPVPAAVWLFGSGLIGLVGIARRRNPAIA